MSNKMYSRVITFIFVLNVLFLMWAILWKCGVPFIGEGAQRVINLMPFRGNTGWEIRFNVMLFMPFAFLLSAATTKKLTRQLIIVISTSVFLEIAQFILAVGRSDITDILLNTFGGAIGICAYYLLVKLCGKHSRPAVMAACMLVAAFILYVSVSIILFGMVRLGNIMFKM